MTHKARLVSTILTFVFVLFAGIISVSLSTQNQSLIKVHANGWMDVDIKVDVTNAGKAVEIENNQLSKIFPGSNLDIADQTFCGAGQENSIVYTLTVTNNTNKDISVYLEELVEENMQNIGAIHTYSVEGRDNNQFQNGGTIASKEVLTICVSLFVKDAGFNANADIELNLSFQGNNLGRQ